MFILTRYGFLLLDNVASQDPLSVSVAILNQFGILPEMFQVGYTKLFFRTGQVTGFTPSFLPSIIYYLNCMPIFSCQIGKLEDTRNRTLNGILRVQSCFRGHKARHLLREMKRGIHTLQSCMYTFDSHSENKLLNSMNKLQSGDYILVDASFFYSYSW